MDLAPLNESEPAARLPDRLAQSRPAIDDEERRPIEVETALAQIGEQGFAHRRVLGRALAQGQHVLRAARIHAHGQENHVVAEVQPVDQDDADVEVVERRGQPRRESGAR